MGPLALPDLVMLFCIALRLSSPSLGGGKMGPILQFCNSFTVLPLDQISCIGQLRIAFNLSQCCFVTPADG